MVGAVGLSCQHHPGDKTSCLDREHFTELSLADGVTWQPDTIDHSLTNNQYSTISITSQKVTSLTLEMVQLNNIPFNNSETIINGYFDMGF